MRSLGASLEALCARFVRVSCAAIGCVGRGGTLSGVQVRGSDVSLASTKSANKLPNPQTRVAHRCCSRNERKTRMTSCVYRNDSSTIGLAGRTRPRLGSVFLTLTLLATLLISSGIGIDSRAAASPGSYCEGNIFHTDEGGIDHAKESFAATCNHNSYNDQLQHQCRWLNSGHDEGWQCFGSRGTYTVGNTTAVSSPVGKSRRGWDRTRMMKAAGSTPLSAATDSATKPSRDELRLTGKVFFRQQNPKGAGLVDGSCSGAVVDNPRKNVVWTAGHCLFKEGQWVTDVVFVPGYNKGGRAPYGIWVAEDMWTVGAMTNSGSSEVDRSENDLGAIRLKRRNGRNIENVTGGLGFAFERHEDLFDEARTLGYPGREEVHACEGEFVKLAAQNGVFCPRLATPGSSGGPIIVSRNDNLFLAGVVSTGSDPDSSNSGVIFTPKFGRSAVNLWRATWR